MAERALYWMSSYALKERLHHIKRREELGIPGMFNKTPAQLVQHKADIASELLLRELEGWGE